VLTYFFQAYVFLREFVLGSNDTGLVQDDNSVVGGEDPDFVEIIPGRDEIFYGSGAVEATHVFPSETIQAWRDFMETARPRTLGVNNDGVIGIKPGFSLCAIALGVVLALI
jgi:hypothetical protein